MPYDGGSFAKAKKMPAENIGIEQGGQSLYTTIYANPKKAKTSRIGTFLKRKLSEKWTVLRLQEKISQLCTEVWKI